MRLEDSVNIFSIGLVSAIALLHLLLFLFYPRERANLFFSLFALGVAARALSADVLSETQPGVNATVLGLTKTYSLALAAFSFLLFLYSAFTRRIARQFWIVLALWVFLTLTRAVFPSQTNSVFFRLLLPCFVVIESLRIIFRALPERRTGAWIVGLGVLLLAVAPTKDAVSFLTHSSLSNFWNTILNQFSICGIIIANSVFLARNFARTNRDLEAQLVQVRELSERELEHQRTAAELRLQNEQERARLALVEQELALAAGIQEGLFPDELPVVAGFEMAAQTRPARVCGGDYYDVLRLETNGSDGASRDEGAAGCRYLFCVADVAGKGLPASLLMSNMQATLRALAGTTNSLAELAARVSELIYVASPSNKFVTAILVEIDPATGAGRYVNAGHNECLLLRRDDQACELLKSTGLPFGMLSGFPYEEKSIQLREGDLLALYSDGVPEAYDANEQEWGEARLSLCLQSVMREPAQAVVNRVFDEIDRFSRGAPQHDDITLLVLKHARAPAA